MKLFTFVTWCLSFIVLVNSQLVNPALVDLDKELVERDGNSTDLLDGFDIPDFLSDIDFEKIAGWADSLLKNGGGDIVESLLVGLKNTQLLPEAIVYIVTHNWTLNIIDESLPILIDLAGSVNTTTLFVALDRSGIVYSIIKGALSDEQFLPSVLEIVKKSLSGVDLSHLFDEAVDLVTRDDIVEKYQPNDNFALVQKRDNIEDLLTTILTEVSDSGLISSTVNTLVADPQFQDAAALLLQGAFENIGSIISDTDFSALAPVISSLWKSGLLQDTIAKALSDGDLLDLVLKDIGALFQLKKIKREDLIKDVEDVLSMSASSTNGSMMSTTSMVSEETSTSVASVTASQYNSEDDAVISNINRWSLGLGLMAPVLLM